MTGRLADIIGLVGSAIFIAAYAYTTFSRTPDRLWLNAANLVGAALLLTSLAIHFNLASFVLEVAWGLIAGVGLMREVWRRAQVRR